MKHIKLFEDFLLEKMLGKPRTTPPKTYKAEKDWGNEKIGLETYFEGKKAYNVMASIAYELGLGFGGPDNQSQMAINNYHDNLCDAEGEEVILKDAFSNKYTFSELKQAVADYAKKKGVIK
jgi:hypothetical protein